MPTSKHDPTNRIDLHRSRLIIAPKDYFLGPVFAATKQNGPREITVGGRRYRIGGFHPIRRDFHPPALDVRHARAIFCLLSFCQPEHPQRTIRFSFNEFCRRYARTNGGRYARAIALIVADLLDSYIKVTELSTGISHEYRLIERIDIEKRPPRRKDAALAASQQEEMWFNGCELSTEFFKVLNRIAELQYFKLDVFTAIRSPLAQAIYLYIPSRAYHHDAAKPFEISLKKILEQVSFTVPDQKSVRKKIFCQNERVGRSILQQLDGAEILSGRFRVAIAPMEDGSDFKLQAWIERFREKSEMGGTKVKAAYLKSGRSIQSFERLLSEIQPLSDYDLELLATAGVDAVKNRRFLELAKTILSESLFVTLLAEAKGEMLEGRKAKKNPDARLIHRLMEAIALPVQ